MDTKPPQKRNKIKIKTAFFYFNKNKWNKEFRETSNENSNAGQKVKY